MQIAGLKVARGDFDGFLALLVDNLSVFLVMISLNLYVVGMPPEIVFGRMVPGAAIGLLAGNIYYAYLAKRIAKKEGRDDITALPFGISIVFVLTYTFGLLLPIKLITGDAVLAWHVAILATIIGALLEIIGSIFAVKIRDFLPRAAMLGVLAGIAVMFIAGTGIAEVFGNPYVGFPALAIILWAYLARGKMPFNLPGGLVVLIVGAIIALALGQTVIDFSGVRAFYPFPWVFQLSAQSFAQIFGYLGVVIPIAIINYAITMDNVESATAVGDNYPIKECLIVDGLASIVGGIFGSPYPNTVFIGHPGYKRMGAKMGYSAIMSVLFVIFSLLGMFSFLSQLIPLAAVTPILIFIGLIMVEVAFKEVPKEHMVASAAAIIVYVPYFAKDYIELTLSALNISITPEVIGQLQAGGVNYLGFYPVGFGGVLISMYIGALVAYMIWRDLRKVSIVCLIGAISSWVGLIHAPALKWGANPQLALAWFIIAAMFFIGSFYIKHEPDTLEGKAL